MQVVITIELDVNVESVAAKAGAVATALPTLKQLLNYFATERIAVSPVSFNVLYGRENAAHKTGVDSSILKLDT